MNLFGKHKKSKRRRYHKAYNVNPSFFSGKNGEPLGAFALREETLAAIPKEPASLYKVGDTAVFDITASVLSYVHSVLTANSSQADELNAMAALYEYWLAAENYR